MNKQQRHKLVQSIVIKTPCEFSWDDLKGDDTTRFCDRCNLNVHNLSQMSEPEIADLLARKNGRLCVFAYRRDDGTIVTDRCPRALRKLRNRITAYAASALLTLSWFLGLSAHAQGLVSAPVDPRYGQGGDVGQMADFGYETGCDIVRVVTFVSFLLTLLVPLRHRADEPGRQVLYNFAGHTGEICRSRQGRTASSRRTLDAKIFCDLRWLAS